MDKKLGWYEAKGPLSRGLLLSGSLLGGSSFLWLGRGLLLGRCRLLRRCRLLGGSCLLCFRLLNSLLRRLLPLALKELLAYKMIFVKNSTAGLFRKLCATLTKTTSQRDDACTGEAWIAHTFFTGVLHCSRTHGLLLGRRSPTLGGGCPSKAFLKDGFCNIGTKL